MKILAYEFITGGGMAGEPIPDALRTEGELMLHALARDLAELPWLEVYVSRDVRMPHLPIAGVRILPVPAGGDPQACYLRALHRVDAVWPVAPETGGMLEWLARAACRHGRRLVGCRPEAIAVTASKLRTSRVLQEAGIPVVPTWASPGELADGPGPWVLKPDDGAGCAETFLAGSAAEARAALSASKAGATVAQPWIAGDALSLSVVVRRSEAVVLSCNRQHLALRKGCLALERLEVNAVAPTPAMRALAQSVVRAVPGLSGYVGIDLVARDGGLTVIEINPRLTTSCAGLRQALGCNLAALVLGSGAAAPPARRAGPSVSIAVASAHA